MNTTCLFYKAYRTISQSIKWPQWETLTGLDFGEGLLQHQLIQTPLARLMQDDTRADFAEGEQDGQDDQPDDDLGHALHRMGLNIVVDEGQEVRGDVEPAVEGADALLDLKVLPAGFVKRLEGGLGVKEGRGVEDVRDEIEVDAELEQVARQPECVRTGEGNLARLCEGGRDFGRFDERRRSGGLKERELGRLRQRMCDRDLTPLSSSMPEEVRGIGEQEQTLTRGEAVLRVKKSFWTVGWVA